MEELLHDREEQRAVLSVRPTALATQSVYRHWRWREVGGKGPLAGVTPPYWDVHVRELGVPHRWSSRPPPGCVPGRSPAGPSVRRCLGGRDVGEELMPWAK
ncbi:hypothetical protein ACVW19_004052 [Streptomyces sp. TE5632]